MSRATVRALATALGLALAFSSAAAGGRAILKAYFQDVLKDQAYQQRAYAKVAKAWKQPAQSPAVGKKTIVQAILDREGKLVSSKVLRASGSKAWDDSVLAAVRAAAPFGPLPRDFAYPTVEAHFHLGWEK